MSEFIAVLITVPHREEGLRIAGALVAEKLAACVNQAGEVNSVYRWQGKMESSLECLLIAKTKRSLFEDLAGRVKELHSYTVPEIIALPIEAGNPEYLKWIEESTR